MFVLFVCSFVICLLSEERVNTDTRKFLYFFKRRCQTCACKSKYSCFCLHTLANILKGARLFVFGYPGTVIMHFLLMGPCYEEIVC